MRPTHATGSTYTRADTDTITIVSPSVRGGARVDDVSFDAAYAADVWSGASIDIRTAATPHVEEIRHEVQGGVSYEGDDFTLGARYRGSFEPDYISHGGVVRGTLDLGGRMTTLSLDLSGSGDEVGRSHDPGFHRAAGRFGARLGWTQILDRETILALTGELLAVLGYQASPYRFVAIGGAGTCASEAPYCLPESLPTDRVRASIAVRGRRALGPHFSAALGYRFYGDSWGVLSHTAEAEISMTPASWIVFSFGYRFYAQGEAVFYQPRYFTPELDFYTRDRKLSSLFTHQVTAELSFSFELDPSLDLLLGVRGSGTEYDYRAFVGLTEVYAVEVTATTGLRFH